ncbi:MAG TPA: flavin reductase family protein [bacterium]|nr:flavin reductase family protein [bacterium]
MRLLTARRRAVRAGVFTAVPLAQAYRLFGANPLVMVTSVDRNGRVNVMTCAWCTPYDFAPPQLLLVIDSGSLTFANIRATGRFTVSIVPEKLAPLAVRCGGVSGRETDKLQQFAVALAPAKKNGVPALAGATAYLECELADRALLRKGLVCGRGRYAAARPAAFRAGAWRTAAGALLHHLGGAEFLAGGRRRRVR